MNPDEILRKMVELGIKGRILLDNGQYEEVIPIYLEAQGLADLLAEIVAETQKLISSIIRVARHHVGEKITE